MKFSRNENLLIAMHEIAKTSDDASIRETCRSLVLWFQRRGEWTPAQVRLCEQLERGHMRTGTLQKARKPRAKKTHQLYAVLVAGVLKVGMTCNLKQRLSAFRVSAPKDQIEVKHVFELGDCGSVHAKAQEKKLHRFLHRFQIEREMFKPEALEFLKAFKPKLRASK